MKHLITSLFILSLFPVSAQAAFPDVPSSHPNYDAINYVQAEGIVEGYESGLYEPDHTINRAEFTKIIVETKTDFAAIEHCGDNLQILFSDTPSDAWYFPYVCAATIDLGLIRGYPDGTFGAAQNINFVEAAKILATANELASEFGGDSNPWYKKYVTALEGKHAIPLSITRFDQPITRGEMAEMVYRLKANVTTKPSRTYEELATQAQVSVTNVIQTPSSHQTKTFSNTLFIEENIGAVKFFGQSTSDYCGDIVSLESTKCHTEKAGYSGKDFWEDGIGVNISIHENLQHGAKSITDQFSKMKITPVMLNGSRVYSVPTYYGSYYYWIHGDKEILIRTLPMCVPSFIQGAEQTHMYGDTKISDEQLLQLKNTCAGLTAVASEYVLKYPSDL